MTINEPVTSNVLSSVGAYRESPRFSGCSGARIWDKRAMLLGSGATTIRGASGSVATLTGQRSRPQAQAVAHTRSHATITAHQGPFLLRIGMMLCSFPKRASCHDRLVHHFERTAGYVSGETVSSRFSRKRDKFSNVC